MVGGSFVLSHVTAFDLRSALVELRCAVIATETGGRMDAAAWYYLTPYRKKAGPVSQDQLIALYLKDSVLPSTLVWSTGMEKWEPFSDKFKGVAPPRDTELTPLPPPPVDGVVWGGSDPSTPPLFPLRGRVGRDAIWVWLLALAGLQFVAILLVYKGGFIQPTTIDGYYDDIRPGIAIVVSLVIGLLMLWPGISVMVRRCHDLGWSGWWTVATFVPYVGLLALVIVGGFVPGAPTANRYGPPPNGGDGKLAERVAQGSPTVAGATTQTTATVAAPSKPPLTP